MIIVEPNQDNSTQTESSRDALFAKLNEINESQKQLQKQPKKLIQFFSDIFYPIDKDLPFPKEFIKIDLIKIVQDIIAKKKHINDGKSIVICRHPAIRKETPFVFGVVPNASKKIINSWMNPQNFDGIKFTPSGYFNTLMSFLQEHLDYINMLCDMCEVYKTESDRNSHKKLWALYNRLKITIE